jgi:chemotaxis protein methyltransferase CheR
MMSLQPKLGAPSPPTSTAREPRSRRRSRAPVSAPRRPVGDASEQDEVRFGWHDFTRVRALLREAAGIALNQQKKAMVYARLASRVRSLGFASFTEYLAVLEDRAHPEWSAFISALTTNLTSFFREPHHFPILAELARVCPRKQPFTVWSAGCASGEEPYSIAMCLSGASSRWVRTHGHPDAAVRVLGTDIDGVVLARACEGIYPLAAIAGLPVATARRFFLRGAGEQAGKVKVRPELARLVSFGPLNLCDEHWELRGELDAIFCRNVMIYLDRAVQRRTLERFAAHLKPHGLLFTGHSENLFGNASDLFRLRGKTVYELAAPAAQRIGSA